MYYNEAVKANVGEDFIHLGGCFHPFLLGVAHTVRVVEILSGTKAD